MHRAGMALVHACTKYMQVRMCSEGQVCLRVKWLLKLQNVKQIWRGPVVFHKTVQYEIWWSGSGAVIYRCVRNAWTDFRNEFPSPEKGKTLYQYMSLQTLIAWSTAPVISCPQSFRFLSVETLKTSMFIFNWKWKDISYAYQTISNHLGTSEMVQQSSNRCVHVCNDSGEGHFENVLWIVAW